MKRRDFLYSACAGLGLAAIAGPTQAALQITDPQHETLRMLTRSIHAQFGTGFNLVSAKHAGGKTECLIESHGNFLVVTSHKESAWAIQSASEM